MALSPRRVVGTAMIAAALCIAGAGADYKESYRAGMEAIEKRDWTAAERLMAEAASQRSGEANRLGAMMFRPYLPYFYLGTARYERGDCRGALQAWDESQRQGEVQKVGDLGRQLQSRHKACETKIAEVASAVAEADAALARARDGAEKITELRKAPELAAAWGTGSPSFADREGQAKSLLHAAQNRRAQGATALDAAAVREAATAATKVAQELGNLFSAASERRQALRAELQKRRTALDRTVATARRTLDASTVISPAPRTLSRARAALQATLREASSPALDLEQIAAVDARLRREEGALQRLAEPPPAPLAGAIVSFLGGDYASVVAALEPFESRERRVQAQACLLRSAARHALYLLGNAQDAALLAAATADGQACKSLGRDAPTASAKIFSPRFVDFYGGLAAPTPPGR